MVDDLTLKVGNLHHIRISDSDSADTGCRQIESSRRTERPGADNKDSAVQQLLLALAPHLLEDDMTGIAFNLLVGKHVFFQPLQGIDYLYVPEYRIFIIFVKLNTFVLYSHLCCLPK
jgi:hypothetical protein